MYCNGHKQTCLCIVDTFRVIQTPARTCFVCTLLSPVCTQSLGEGNVIDIFANAENLIWRIVSNRYYRFWNNSIVSTGHKRFIALCNAKSYGRMISSLFATSNSRYKFMWFLLLFHVWLTYLHWYGLYVCCTGHIQRDSHPRIPMLCVCIVIISMHPNSN